MLLSALKCNLFSLNNAIMKMVFSVFFCFLFIHLYAQTVFEPANKKLVISSKKTYSKLVIDGQLTEAAWQEVEAVTNFIQVEPNQGMPSAFNTYVKVLYDEQYLYVGAFCEDKEGKQGIRVPDLLRDFSFRSNETFAVGIDGFLDERNSITLAVNPYGTQKDYLSFDDTFFDSDWNGLWKVRTSIQENGWYAEFQIPWKTIRYRVEEEGATDWGINFVRMRRKSNEISAWSAYPRSFGFNRSEYFGLLKNFTAPKPKANLQFNPYVLRSFEQQKIKETSVKNHKNKLGGELKWGINSNTFLDATFNTDFAQADADIQVNNISRFSIFFPEKRQFFLENASLFGTGLYNENGASGNMIIIPFFSRRIGLNDAGLPVSIDGGLRLVHQSPKRSIGFISVRENENDQRPYNFVGRYTQNFGKQNRLGTIITTRIANGKTNLVGGLDGFIRLSKAHSLNFMMLSSSDEETDKTGFGGYLQYQYNSNNWTAWWTQSLLNEDFNPLLGFVSRRNVIATTPGIIANYRGQYLPFKQYIRAFSPRFNANWYHQASNGTLTEREFNISPFWLEAQNGGFLSFTTKFIHQHITTAFSLLDATIPIGKYNYARYNFGLGTDPSSKISTKLAYEFGDFYNGQLQSWNLSVNFIPIPHFFLKGSLSNNKFETKGSMDNHINLYTVEGRFYLNPRLNLSGIYQRNTQDNSHFYNIRFAWEYRPLSYIYLVYNSNKKPIDQLTNFSESRFIIKLNFLGQL
jgi:hypothetical protein